MTFIQLIIGIIVFGCTLGGIAYLLMKDMNKPLLKRMEIREKELELEILREKNKKQCQ